MFTKPLICVNDVRIVAKHYIIAAIWADAPEGTHPRASKQACQQASDVSQQFLNLLTEDQLQGIREAYDTGDYGRHPDCGTELPWMAALGHDLYLSRSGAGCGFLDRDSLPEELRSHLASLCGWRNIMGESETDFSRGWLYFVR